MHIPRTIITFQYKLNNWSGSLTVHIHLAGFTPKDCVKCIRLFSTSIVQFGTFHGYLTSELVYLHYRYPSTFDFSLRQGAAANGNSYIILFPLGWSWSLRLNGKLSIIFLTYRHTKELSEGLVRGKTVVYQLCYYCCGNHCTFQIMPS